MIGSIYYPMSDTSFVAFFGAVHHSLGSLNSQFVLDKRGKVVKLLDHQSNLNNPLIYWRQDSSILQALEIFETDSGQEVLSAFRKAYEENPDHYYLANYIKHLEFVPGNDYLQSRVVLESSLVNMTMSACLWKKINSSSTQMDGIINCYPFLKISS